MAQNTAGVATQPSPPFSTDRGLVTLGLLVEATTRSRGEVAIDTLEKRLRNRGIEWDTEQLKDELDDVIASHCWLGLAWVDPDRTRLATIAGVRWFCESSMYEQLTATRPQCRVLTNQFAELAQDLDRRFTNPRMLVGAGATTFHCLFHERCQRLRRQAQCVLTNNFFVALRWQEEFNDQGKVHLIGGVPSLDMAATVDNEKLAQWLRARSRRPDVSLISWHFVKPENDGSVTLWTKNTRELALKRAATDLTEGVLYIVCGQEKITGEVPKGGKSYSLERLLDIQKQKKNQRREVYFITNVEEPSPEQQRVIDCLSQDRFAEHRVWLVSPCTGLPNRG